MDVSTADPLSETGAEPDLRAFYRLISLAVQHGSFDSLLAILADHLNVASLVIAAPDDQRERATDSDNPLSVPLVYHDRRLSELCATPQPGADIADLAARLEFFSPAIALFLVMNTRFEERATESAQRRRQTRDLYDERDRLEAVLEATNDAILLVDTQDTLAMATPQFETFTGISRYDILGMPVDHLVQQIGERPGLPAAMTNMISALTGNFTEGLGGEFELTEPQRRILVWYSLPVYVRSGVLLGRIFAFRDATRERELDRMKTDFISLVSHELRTPLTSVKGFSDLLLENSADQLDPESREYLDIIAFNADRLVALINDILDITRIDTDRIELKPELCMIGEVVEQAANTLRAPLDQRGHTLTVDVPHTLPPIWADRSRLVQVMSNLLSNAIKYTLHPGEITVRALAANTASDLPAAAPRAQIFPCIVVSVRDTGIGIAPGDAEKLFHRFYRIETSASRGVGGTGLGLAIVKSLVELQGGRVWFESVPMQGSTFSFSIPAASGSHLERY